MRRVVIGMIALSPEWDRWFDEAFTDLITSDADLVRAEFDALIAASSRRPPAPPSPPAPSATASNRTPVDPADSHQANDRPTPDAAAQDSPPAKGG
jgi:hypothetical protein